MHGFFRKLKNSPAMIVAVIAVVFAMSGSAFAAKTLITGKDIKKGSITTKNLSKKTVKSLKGKKGAKGSTGATGAAGPQGAPGATGLTGAPGATGAKGDTGAAGANGANGENGVDGQNGERGAQGLQGEPGDPGEPGPAGTFDDEKVTPQTAALFGFTPWYDTSDSSVISFEGSTIKLDNGGNGIGGVNLPIARGTSLSALESVDYTQTGRATLRLEVYLEGGIYQNLHDYTTLYFVPAADGAVSDAFTTGTWTATGAGATLDGKTWSEIMGSFPDRAAQNKAIILSASLGTPNSQNDVDKPTTATVSDVTLKLNHAKDAAVYKFGLN